MIDIEKIRDAILNCDIDFLTTNKNAYDIDARLEEDENDTLLLFAIGCGENESYKFFLQNGSDVHAKNSENENIIHAIVYSGDVNRLDYILSKGYYVNIDDKTVDGATPLLISLALGNLEMAKRLIEYGANINIADNEGLTPLHIACQEGYTEMAHLLVDKGAIVRLKSAKGNYPLMLAIAHDYEELSRFMFAKHFQ